MRETGAGVCKKDAGIAVVHPGGKSARPWDALVMYSLVKF